MSYRRGCWERMMRERAEELALKRNLTPAQVSERTGLRIEACRHIFRRPGVPYGN